MKIDWFAVRWFATIAVVVAVVAGGVTLLIVAAISSSDSCTQSGGQEVFQYFLPAGKGILVPVYACEGQK